MGFVKRFGGWRPVESERGVGRLHGEGDRSLEGVEYRFEVWHQMVDGFPGPYRSEGSVTVASRSELEPFVGGDAVLELEDGRRLGVRIGPGGALLAHERPEPRGSTLAEANPDSTSAGKAPTTD